MPSMSSSIPLRRQKVLPDDLTRGFHGLGLGEGTSVMLHASLESMGSVEGGEAMVLQRLLKVIGRSGTLLMPTFTSVTRHSSFHADFSRPGCWCGGNEARHVPFIAELQPDKSIGSIAFRLCSWPASRRSKHPGYSYVAVGNHTDELVRTFDPSDPLWPIKRLLKHDPIVVTLGQPLDSVTAIQLAEQENASQKFIKEKALAMSSKGQVWVDITSLGCSRGYSKLQSHSSTISLKESHIGFASARAYRMRTLVDMATELLSKNNGAMRCDNVDCLSCELIAK